MLGRRVYMALKHFAKLDKTTPCRGLVCAHSPTDREAFQLSLPKDVRCLTRSFYDRWPRSVMLPSCR